MPMNRLDSDLEAKKKEVFLRTHFARSIDEHYSSSSIELYITEII